MKITREELYRAVWEKPAVQLAKEYGISDVALGKLCRRLRIPKPVKGHWVKVKSLRRVRRPGLPAFEGSESIEITPSPPRPSLHVLASLRLEVSENVLITPKQEPSPVVGHLTRQRDQLRASAPDGNYRENLQGLRVTPGLTDRALLFFDAVLKALQGFDCHALPLKDKPRDLGGLILRRGETDVEVWLVEEMVATKKLISPMPAWARTPEQQQRYFKKTWSYTGKLEFRIREYGLNHERTRWRDTTQKRLEDQLDGVVAGVINTADRLRLRAEDQRREQKRWQEAQEARRQEQRRRQEEEGCRKALEDAAERWAKCQQMRAYLAAYEDKLEAAGQLNVDTEASRWLAWANAYVERQDPLRSATDPGTDQNVLGTPRT